MMDTTGAEKRWDPEPVPDVSEGTATRLEEVRGRRTLVSPGEHPRNAETVTPTQIERAAKLMPGWMEPFLPELVAYTLAHLGGQRRFRGAMSHAFVFVFHGQEFAGLHDAASAWRDGFDPLLAEVEKRGLKGETVATYLGKIAGKAIAGAGPNKPYVRPSMGDPHPSLPFGETEERETPAHLNVEREPVDPDRLRSLAVSACESEQLESVRLSPAQALWLADVLEAGRE